VTAGRKRDRLLAAIATAAALGATGYACGGSEAKPKAAADEKKVKGLAKDDSSRCDHKGRADREVVESAGPGAEQPNVRRVFAIIGEGEDRRRILLCREVDTNLDGIKDVVRTYNDKGDVLNELSDANFDGKIDTWASFSRGRVSKVQLDNDGDGSPDETRFYVAGKLNRVQRDTNRDGKPDVWEIYDEGHLQRMGVDLDHDGHVDRWDRDEVAMRALAEKEREDEEKEAAEEERKKRDGGGVTDARVSARNR
jgi:hypothetical protein